MRLLFELSMECEPLARAEAMSAMRALGSTPAVLAECEGTLAVSGEIDPKALASRLGLCHHVSEWMGSCEPGDLMRLVRDLDVPGPIRVRATKVGMRKVDLPAAARDVGGVLGGSKGVDLHSPASEIRLVFSDKVHIGRLLGSVDRASFEKRKNRYMPFIYPASIHPKFARASVNLTEVRMGERLLDPFCGTGAIVLEAALIGCEAIGSDVSERMIDGATRNLAHSRAAANMHRCDIGDVPRIVGKVSGVATDLPYGRSTSTGGEGLPALYERAFEAFHEVLEPGGRLVSVLPDPRQIPFDGRFKMLESYELRVHRSLTRHFCVLESL